MYKGKQFLINIIVLWTEHGFCQKKNSLLFTSLTVAVKNSKST